MRPVSKAFIGFSKGYVTPPPNSKNDYRDEKGVEEDSWESLGLQGDLGVHWKEWCWSWNSSYLATWCEELTHLKRPWCWERLRAGGEGVDRGCDGWTASLTQWAWVWVNSGSWRWTGRPGVLKFMGMQRVGHGWVTDMNWILRWQE